MTTISTFKPAYEALARLNPNLSLGGASFRLLYDLAGLVVVGSDATDEEWDAILAFRKDYKAGGYVWEVEA